MISWDVTGVVQNWTFPRASFKGFYHFTHAFIYLVWGGFPELSNRVHVLVPALRQDPGILEKVPFLGLHPFLYQPCFLPVPGILPSPGSIYNFQANLLFPWYRLESDLTLSSN